VGSVINQGGRNLTTSGTQITQPLTSLLKIKQANEIAETDAKASREKADLTENDVALAVHQVYYSILIAQARRSAKGVSGPAGRTHRTGEIRRRVGTGIHRKPRANFAIEARAAHNGSSVDRPPIETK